jgi:uncharacterized damage-inducible protein DinB
MFTSNKSFQGTWKRETGVTERVLAALTDAGLAHRPHVKSRSAGELGWHLATAPLWFANEVLKLGVKAEAPTAAPASAAGYAAAYRRIALACGEAVARKGDGWLALETDFFGTKMPNGAILATMLFHEIHHRGQLSAYLRPIGASVPAIYGPSGDEGM